MGLSIPSAPPKSSGSPPVASDMPRLLELPPEIRNTIYEHALVFSQPLQVRHKHIYDINQTDRAPLQACQQIRREALSIYYSSNTFIFSSIHDLEDWLDTTRHSLTRIREVRLAPGPLEGHNYDFRETQTPHNGERHEIRLALSEGKVITSSVGGNVNVGMLDFATTQLASTAKHLAVLDAEHQLMVTSIIAHCFHCANGGCLTCKQRNGCCKGT